MKAITVCVDYAPLLAKTLPHNAIHFDRMVVVTTPEDRATLDLCAEFCNVTAFATRAFYEKNALFNKGKAMEEGFDILGRSGWMMVLDADIVLPHQLPEDLECGNLYSPFRRMCFDGEWDGDFDWVDYPRYGDREFAGYCQVFHADDPALKARPWYGVNWRHAGGCDSDFQAKWPEEKKIRPDWEVLHLGRPMHNWGGVGEEKQRRLKELLSRRRRAGDYAHERL